MRWQLVQALQARLAALLVVPGLTEVERLSQTLLAAAESTAGALDELNRR